MTSRTAIADLAAPHPVYTRGPNLALPTRYPESVILPDDTVFVTGGAGQYRGEHDSDNHIARIYHPQTDTFTKAASPGSRPRLPLRGGAASRRPRGDARLQPALRQRRRLQARVLRAAHRDLLAALSLPRPAPTITGGPQQVALGGSASFTTSNPADIAKVRLIHPSAATHVTDLQQRSIALTYTRTANGIHVTIPPQQTLVPLGLVHAVRGQRQRRALGGALGADHAMSALGLDLCVCNAMRAPGSKVLYEESTGPGARCRPRDRGDAAARPLPWGLRRRFGAERGCSVPHACAGHRERPTPPQPTR